MKYMIPEINISQFSEENIVTLSATGQAKEALEALGTADAPVSIVATTLDDWISQ